MVVGEKNHQKFSDRFYQKVFNKDDPFDRLIMELGENGVLDIGVVGIGDEHTKHPKQRYSRRPTPPKGTHTS